MNVPRFFLLAAAVACSRPPELVTVERLRDARQDAGATVIGTPTLAAAKLVTDEVAGSRLRPVFERLDAADGATLLRPDGWFDLEGNQPCTFERVSDGTVRCMPNDPGTQDLALFVEVGARDTGTSAPDRLRLVTTTWTGNDGSQAVTSRVIDTDRNETCSHGRDVNGTERCLPAVVPVTEHDLPDATCKRPALSVPRTQPASRYVARIDAEACLATEVFPALVGPPCADRGDGYHYFAEALSAPVPPTAFAELAAVTRDAEPGYYGTSGRRLVLRRAGEAAEGFERLDRPELFDTSTGERCVAALLDDGQLHCAGVWEYLAFDQNVHADALCNDPVVGVRRRGCAPSRPLLARWPRAAGEPMVLLERGVPLGGGTVWERDARGTCAPALWVTHAMYDVFRLAALSPARASRFVTLTRTLVK